MGDGVGFGLFLALLGAGACGVLGVGAVGEDLSGGLLDLVHTGSGGCGWASDSR